MLPRRAADKKIATTRRTSLPQLATKARKHNLRLPEKKTQPEIQGTPKNEGLDSQLALAHTGRCLHNETTRHLTWPLLKILATGQLAFG
jgi:hypothetical protein